jgi:transposase
MVFYAGLDVSDKATHICVVTSDGRVHRRDAVASDPEVLAKWLKRHCPAVNYGDTCNNPFIAVWKLLA